MKVKNKTVKERQYTWMGIRTAEPCTYKQQEEQQAGELDRQGSHFH